METMLKSVKRKELTDIARQKLSDLVQAVVDENFHKISKCPKCSHEIKSIKVSSELNSYPAVEGFVSELVERSSQANNGR